MMDGMAPTRALTTTSSGQRRDSAPGGAQSLRLFQDHPSLPATYGTPWLQAPVREHFLAPRKGNAWLVPWRGVRE